MAPPPIRLPGSVLALLMLATRGLHTASVPDASGAVLFLAGFFLTGLRPLGLLLAEAVAIDYVSTQHLGLSSHCLSPAYVAIVPGSALLYAAGRLARAWAKAVTWRDAALVLVCVLVSVSLCFALTDGSFYWLSGRYAHPEVSGWAAHFLKWYAHFLVIPTAYCALAFAIQGVWLRCARIPCAATAPRH